ncbi:hypothetical protein LJC23_05145 [Desulfovibrio sp. OttesenSCG-928-I05]|nr:hypothetical protein [Desulfovibrio sp. OttesenSCG-928-I05]
MDLDMHYYATYLLSRSVGLSKDIALRVASASQYTDDFVDPCWLRGDDGDICVFPSAMRQDTEDPRIFDNIFTEIPFHFLPGGEGDSVEEKLVARRGGRGIQRMLEEVFACRNTTYLPELMGIAAHALMDSYAHWGFSGMRGPWNAIAKESIRTDGVCAGAGKEECGKVRSGIASLFFPAAPKDASGPTGNGHDDAGMLPDLPYVRWRCVMRGDDMVRDNTDLYLQACHALHEALCRFKVLWRSSGNMTAFVNLREPLCELLSVREFSGTCRAQFWSQLYEELFPGETIPEYAEQKAALDGREAAFGNFSRGVTYFRTMVLGSVLPSLGIVLLPSRSVMP